MQQELQGNGLPVDGVLHVQNGEIDAYPNVWRCSRDHLHVTGYTYDGKRVNLNVSSINFVVTSNFTH